MIKKVILEEVKLSIPLQENIMDQGNGEYCVLFYSM